MFACIYLCSVHFWPDFNAYCLELNSVKTVLENTHLPVPAFLAKLQKTYTIE